MPCEIFAISFAKRRCKSPGLEMLKNVMGSDVVTQTRIFKIENWLFKMSIYMECLKCYLEKLEKSNSKISAIYGCRNKPRYFPTSSLSEVGDMSCRFHAAAGPETCLSFICVAQFSPDHKALTCKCENRVKSRVSNERREAEIMSNSLHLNIDLDEDYGISNAFATG